MSDDGAGAGRNEGAGKDDDAIEDPIAELVEAGERLLYEGSCELARRIFVDAVAQTEARSGRDCVELVVPLLGLARATASEGAAPPEALAEELALQARALRIAEAELASDDMLLAEVLQAHGASTWGAGDPAKGAALLARAVAVARAAEGDVAGFLAPLVGALVDDGRAREALPHARELLRLEDVNGEADLTTLFVVGRCFREAGARAEAREVLARFLASFGEGGDAAIRQHVQQWLVGLAEPEPPRAS